MACFQRAAQRQRSHLGAVRVYHRKRSDQLRARRWAAVAAYRLVLGLARVLSHRLAIADQNFSSFRRAILPATRCAITPTESEHLTLVKRVCAISTVLPFMISIPQYTFGAGYRDRLNRRQRSARDCRRIPRCARTRRQKILLIVPDATRTAPVGLMFQTIYELVQTRVRKSSM
jgi:hypothetical protein